MKQPPRKLRRNSTVVEGGGNPPPSTVNKIVRQIVIRVAKQIQNLEATVMYSIAGKRCDSIHVEGKRTWRCQREPKHKGQRHTSFAGHRNWD